MTTKELRRAFLDYFWQNDHLIRESFSLVSSDKSTLFTSAGMQPLIPYFLGTARPPQPRMATCQKCFRADDLDKVGFTWRHLSFFEMLGNFSFGDYFKKEAIRFGWEFFTEVLRLPKDRLWISVYKEDEESYDIWKKDIGLEEVRIVRLGKEDNWWGPVGATGPCGPDTEIHYDRGPQFGCGRADCQPGCSCDRWGELWNIVFQQYDQQPDGTLVPLPRPGIDTGLGLERLAAAVQGKETVFDIDIFAPIVSEISRLLGVAYGEDPAKDSSLRIIADHIRAITFIAAEGIVPSNEGHGYVLRRLIRRGMRLAWSLGKEEPFLHQLVTVVADQMKDAYPELKERREILQRTVFQEESRFEETLEVGLARLEDKIEEAIRRGNRKLSGRDAFVLYDTYGFPLELTLEIAREAGLQVDTEEFEQEMERQRQRARLKTKFVSPFEDRDLEGLPPTEFFSYMPESEENLEGECRVLKVLTQGKDVWCALDRTPFYAEGGGQLADKGYLLAESTDPATASGIFRVVDAQWIGDIVAHKVEVEKGTLAVGQRVWAKVDRERRQRIRRAHTATHLLHAALRNRLGPSVFQSGSVVDEDRLRFDFSYPKPLTDEEIKAIEDEINGHILSSIPVQASTTTLQEARRLGAMALFGEKYGERVRMIQINGVSLELCGGSHLSNTSQIGLFKVVSQSGIGANIRRIEALTGEKARRFYEERMEILKQGSSLLEVPPEQLLQAIEELKDRLREIEKKWRELREQSLQQKIADLLSSAQEVQGVRVVTGVVTDMDIESLRRLADQLEVQIQSGIIVLGTVDDGKVIFVSKVTKDVVARGGHAGHLVRDLAKITDGGGGGRPDFAQAGGRNPARLREALRKVPELVIRQIQKS
ncbi:MAG: alanine--tRNA ligase [Armatimonadetes bacterium]|nr:alanine--tRNA ligase [Armatimonadota bacterium]MDW8122596.1 alanine--tRNA ligase [Armatimonadota bacterium]